MFSSLWPTYMLMSSGPLTLESNTICDKWHPEAPKRLKQVVLFNTHQPVMRHRSVMHALLRGKRPTWGRSWSTQWPQLWPVASCRCLEVRTVAGQSVSGPQRAALDAPEGAGWCPGSPSWPAADRPHPATSLTGSAIHKQDTLSPDKYLAIYIEWYIEPPIPQTVCFLVLTSTTYNSYSSMNSWMF